jgi:hypothetical protein
MKGNEEGCASADSSAWVHGRRRNMRGTYRRPARLAVLVAAAALALAACGGSAASPQVASLGKSSSNGNGSGTASGDGSGSSAATGPSGNPTQLLAKWTACMHSHGDPGQAAPTIDASKVIHMTTPLSVNIAPNGQNPDPPGAACLPYLQAASTALQAGYSPPKPPSQAALLKYAECMRANGVPDFPDPTAGGGLVFRVRPGSDLDPSSPIFQNSARVCAQKTGVHMGPSSGPAPPGSIDDNGDVSVSISGGNGGPGA